MDNRRSALLAWPEIAVVAIIAALALAGGGYSGLALGAATVFVWLSVVAVLLSGRAEPDRVRPQLVTGSLCLMTLAGFTAFSLLWGSDDGAGFVDLVRSLGYAGAFILAGLVVRPGRLEQALTAVAGGIFVVALIALTSRLGGIGNGDAGLVAAISTTTGRLSYPIGYWNGLGALMALGVPLLVWIGSEPRRPRAPAWSLAALCPLLLVAFMTSSRGALLAAILGTAVVVGFAEERRRAAAAFGVAFLAALPAICMSALLSEIAHSPGTGAPGAPEAAVAGALVAGMALAAGFGGRIVVRLTRIGSKYGRLRPAPLLAVTLVIGIGLVVISGPSRFLDDFRSLPAHSRTDAGGGLLTVSGTGRAQFWGTALDAFADAPLKGVGAGSYATYWNIHGSLDTPTKNAHSEPLELLAELGLVGFGTFVAFFVVVVMSGIRRAGGADRAGTGAALGLITAASVGFLIDWTWQIPAVVVPVLIVAAVLTGSALQAPGPRKVRWGARGQLSLGRWRGPAIATTVVAMAIPALWAGGVLALASSQLDSSDRALSSGEYGSAAQSARAAASLEPWSAEPWLQLAAVERGAGNFEAAQRDAAAAIDRAPEDFRPWVLAALVENDRRDYKASLSYTLRANLLAPRVLARIYALGLVLPAGT